MKRVVPLLLVCCMVFACVFLAAPSASAFDGESAVLRTYRVGINEPANWFHLLVDDDSYFFVLESNGYGTYGVSYLGNNQIEIRFFVEFANVPEGFIVSPELYRLNYPNGVPRLDQVEFTDGLAGEGYAVYIYTFEFVSVSTSSITCAFGPNLAYTIDNLDFYTHEVYFAGDVDYRDLIAVLEGIEKEQNTFYAWFQKTWEPFRVSLVKSLQNLADIGNNVISRLGQIRDYIIDGFKVQSSFFDWYKSAWTMTYNAVTGFFNTWQTKLQNWFSSTWEKMTSGFTSVVAKLDALIEGTGAAADKVKDDAAGLSQAGSDLKNDLGSITDFEDQQFGVLDDNFGSITAGGDITNLFEPMSWVLTLTNYVVEAVPSNYRSYWTVPFFFGIFFIICQHSAGVTSTAHAIEYHSKPKRTIGFRTDD